MITKKQLRNSLYALNVPIYSSNNIKKKDLFEILAHYQTQGGVKIPLDFVKEVIISLKKALKEKKHPNIEKFNDLVKKYTSGTLLDFANSAIEYLKNGKLKWEDEFGLLQDEYQPGFEIIPWTFLKRQLEDISPELEKQLPRAFTQRKA